MTLSLHTLGEISLNISTGIYFIWFLPQLILTFKSRVISHLSLGMHTILVIGYSADLMYGFGQHLPIQYKLVSMVGLILLIIEHYQFWAYKKWQEKDKIVFNALTLFFIFLFFYAIYTLILRTHSPQFYNWIGASSWICWLFFMFPQIWKNFLHQSVEGVSIPSVSLAILSNVGDIISAFCLAFAWPNKIGSCIILLPKFILLMQCLCHTKSHTKKIGSLSPMASP